MQDTALTTPNRLSWVTRLGVFGLALLGLVLAGDLAYSGWSAGRIYPGVSVAGVQLGGKTRAQARQMIAAKASNYHVTVYVSGKVFPATAADLGAHFDTDATVSQAYAIGRGRRLALLGLMDSWVGQADLKMSYSVDREVLKDYVSRVVEAVGQAPVDAKITVDGGVPKVEADRPGRSVEGDRLTKLVEGSMQGAGPVSLNVKPVPLEADVRTADVNSTVTNTTELVATTLSLTYKDQQFVPTPTQIGDWLAFEKTNINGSYVLEPKVDSTKLKDYTQNLANKIDLAPVNQQITLKNGVSTIDKAGVDGFALDQASVIQVITTALTSKTALTYELTTKPVHFKTITNEIVSLDIGTYIEISLSTQHLWVYQDHNVIYESAITSGATGAGLATVTGLFSIYYKTTNTRLRGYQYGYNYDVPVKYWMPFYQGFGLHDAVWRNGKFGGPDYYYGGSHGCVNLPDDTAAFIYNWSAIGTPVWVHK